MAPNNLAIRGSGGHFPEKNINVGEEILTREIQKDPQLAFQNVGYALSLNIIYDLGKCIPITLSKPEIACVVHILL